MKESVTCLIRRLPGLFGKMHNDIQTAFVGYVLDAARTKISERGFTPETGIVVSHAAPKRT